MSTAKQFDEDRTLIVRGFLEDPLLLVAYRYALRSAQLGLWEADEFVPGAASMYSDPLMETLLEVSTASLEELTGLELHPTYSYTRLYRKGDSLPRHRDKPACEISVTLCLGGDPGEAGDDYGWPIQLRRSEASASKAVVLRPGDCVVYRGCELEHWRDALQGDHQAQTFLHYVDRNGTHSDLKWDRRPALGVRGH